MPVTPPKVDVIQDVLKASGVAIKEIVGLISDQDAPVNSAEYVIGNLLGALEFLIETYPAELRMQAILDRRKLHLAQLRYCYTGSFTKEEPDPRPTLVDIFADASRDCSYTARWSDGEETTIDFRNWRNPPHNQSDLKRAFEERRFSTASKS